MNQHEVHLEGRRERASATPTVPERMARAALVPTHRHSATPSREGTLDGRLRWFAAAVMTPETAPGLVGEGEAAHFLTAGPALSALERLEIYRRAYHARLIECLADDYPVLRHALGEAVFDELCRAYIARHPSSSPSLNYFGGRMAAFCRDDALASFAVRGFAADLAALEWAIVEVIHARSSQPLTLDGLGQVAAAAWTNARLEPNTAFRLLRFDYPVNAFFQAIKDGANPALPEPASSATVVYRNGPTVWRMDLTPPMFEVLSALARGEPLGASLERAEQEYANEDPSEVAQRVTHWFREWVGSGLFVRVLLRPGTA